MAFDVENFIEKMVKQLGYELVDLEIINHGQLLRVFIDKPDLVNIDDCVLENSLLNVDLMNFSVSIFFHIQNKNKTYTHIVGE